MNKTIRWIIAVVVIVAVIVLSAFVADKIVNVPIGNEPVDTIETVNEMLE